MKARTFITKEIFPHSVRITAEGEVSTRPRFSFRQEIVLKGRECPDFEFKHPFPYYYSWDNSKNEEKTQEIKIITEVSRVFQDFPPKTEMFIRQWTKKGHIWREIEINGIKGTQEIWYQEHWDHGTLYKDLWIEWNRGEAREEMHFIEADGLRIRYFFRKAKQVIGPPGFFWYKKAQAALSGHSLARLFRFALNPELFKLEGRITAKAQDFGYQKWPSDLWLKIVYDSEHGIYWQRKETVENNPEKTVIRCEQWIEEKKVKI